MKAGGSALVIPVIYAAVPAGNASNASNASAFCSRTPGQHGGGGGGGGSSWQPKKLIAKGPATKVPNPHQNHHLSITITFEYTESSELHVCLKRLV